MGQNHPYMNRIQLKPHTSTENILVQWFLVGEGMLPLFLESRSETGNENTFVKQNSMKFFRMI